ncbi:50S ribosomal protein L28 [Gammaproteobacteria bacterium]|nr:50S ribosomal protein L28 [Gammaproteobacteria bacterium]
MAVCRVTQRKRMMGYHVSHAKNHRKRSFKLNIQTKRYSYEGRVFKLKLSTKAIRLIDKIGFESALERGFI